VTGLEKARDAFIEAACVPLDAGHASGTLDEAAAILAAHPDLPGFDLHVAAILGDEADVRRLLDRDPASATAAGGPRGWDPLTHLCFSRYLRLDLTRSGGFVRAATALLDAGASASTGWWERRHQPSPVWESVLYGAAGVAHHAALTRLLLERGADPNDEETPYHVPEGRDNAALQVLLESGTLTADSLATMLLRKADWHDTAGVRLLLEHGADPNRMTRWGRTALHQAILRDNEFASVEAMLDSGADPQRPFHGMSPIALAARRGRGDILASIGARGMSLDLSGVDRLVAACAGNDEAGIRMLVEREPHQVTALLAEGGRLLAAFAGNGNADGVRRLLDLGVAVGAVFAEGDGYWDVAPGSTALHVAAWRARHDTVRLLVARGAAVDAKDGRGRTPLALAVRACVDSYWSDRRSPESVRALLGAGASTAGIPFPSGYQEVDDLVQPPPG
jgi:ankyrin repeat protein